MFSVWPLRQGYDGVYFVRTIEAARASVTRYHEFPFWNPYECGGVPLWDNPQGLTSSPLLWILLPLGGDGALRAWHIVHGAFGFLSMWVLARKELGLRTLGTFLASLTWAFAGFHWQHASSGHASFAAFQYLPLAIFLSRRGEKSIPHAVFFGALLANVLLEGGTYPAPFMGMALALEALTRCTSFRRALSVFKTSLIASVVAVGLSAPKLLPLIDQFEARSRQLDREPDVLTLRTIFEMLTARVHAMDVVDHRWRWHEYGSYVGLFSFVLAAVGLVLALRRARWIAFVLAGGLLLVLGDFHRDAPWTLLNIHVFPFREMRVPSRWIVLPVFSIALLAGLGFDAIERTWDAWSRSRPRTWRFSTTAVLVIALLVAALDLLSAPFLDIPLRFREPPPPKAHVADHLYLGGADLPPPLGIIAANRSALICLEDWGDNSGAPLWTGDLPQVRTRATHLRVAGAVRTQNRFSVDLSPPVSGRLFFNTNFDRNWHTSAGRILNWDRALAVDVPEGTEHVEVWYEPRKFKLGLAIFFATLLGAGAVLLRAARRRN